VPEFFAANPFPPGLRQHQRFSSSPFASSSQRRLVPAPAMPSLSPPATGPQSQRSASVTSPCPGRANPFLPTDWMQHRIKGTVRPLSRFRLLTLAFRTVTSNHQESAASATKASLSPLKLPCFPNNSIQNKRLTRSRTIRELSAIH
jgi:hypothetical protein